MKFIRPLSFISFLGVTIISLLTFWTCSAQTPDYLPKEIKVFHLENANAYTADYRKNNLVLATAKWYYHVPTDQLLMNLEIDDAGKAPKDIKEIHFRGNELAFPDTLRTAQVPETLTKEYLAKQLQSLQRYPNLTTLTVVSENHQDDYLNLFFSSDILKNKLKQKYIAFDDKVEIKLLDSLRYYSLSKSYKNDPLYYLLNQMKYSYTKAHKKDISYPDLFFINNIENKNLQKYIMKKGLYESNMYKDSLKCLWDSKRPYLLRSLSFSQLKNYFPDTDTIRISAFFSVESFGDLVDNFKNNKILLDFRGYDKYIKVGTRKNKPILKSNSYVEGITSKFNEISKFESLNFYKRYRYPFLKYNRIIPVKKIRGTTSGHSYKNKRFNLEYSSSIRTINNIYNIDKFDNKDLYFDIHFDKGKYNLTYTESSGLRLLEKSPISIVNINEDIEKLELLEECYIDYYPYIKSFTKESRARILKKQREPKGFADSPPVDYVKGISKQTYKKVPPRNSRYKNEITFRPIENKSYSLPKLKKFRVRGSEELIGFKDLSASKDLQYLYIDCWKFTHPNPLPKEIEQMKNLKFLFVNIGVDNEIPMVLQKMKNLEEVTIRASKITNLDTFFGKGFRMKNLKSFKIIAPMSKKQKEKLDNYLKEYIK